MTAVLPDPATAIRRAWDVVRCFRIEATDFEVFDEVGRLTNIHAETRMSMASYGGHVHVAQGVCKVWEFDFGDGHVMRIVPAVAHPLVIGETYRVLFCGQAHTQSGVPQTVIRLSTKHAVPINSIDVLARKMRFPIPKASNVGWFIAALSAMGISYAGGWYGYLGLAGAWAAFTLRNVVRHTRLTGALRTHLARCEDFWQ